MIVPLCFTLLVTWAAPLVTIAGNSSCPPWREVAARLESLLPEGAVGATNFVARELDRVELDDESGGTRLRITLRRPDGAVVARRWLERRFSCDDLAAAAAVMIAAWQSDVHPEFRLRVEQSGHGGAAERGRPEVGPPAPAAANRTAPPASKKSVVAVAPLSPPTDGTPPALPVDVDATPVPSLSPIDSQPRARSVVVERTPTPNDVVTLAPRPRPSTSRVPGGEPPSEIDVGLAFLGSYAGGDQVPVPGGSLSAGWTSRGGARWGGHVMARGTAERSVSLLSGEGNWRRVSLAVGPHRRWNTSSGRLALDLHAEGVAALLTMRGTGFASNGSEKTFDPGMGVGARLAFGRGAFRPWVGVGMTAWLLSHLLYEQPSDRGAALPRIEVMLALGVSFWRGP